MKNKTPLISVVMPVYNAEKHLGKAIQSIINQTFKDFEFIIINDGSTDQSKKIILSYNDERIRYIENEKNLQLIKTLNKGLDIAKGKYIARMDADDISLSTRFEEQYHFMENNVDIIMCGSWAKKIGASSGLLYKPTSNDEIIEGFVVSPSFIHPTVMLRNSVLKENNIKYDREYVHAEDYKLWFELLKIGKGANLPKVLLKYRISEEQISSKYAKLQAKTARKIKREFIKYYFNRIGLQRTLPKTITLETIQQYKQYKRNKMMDSIIYTMYLSLYKYSFKSFIFFLFSFDYFKFPYTFEAFMRVFVKHLKPTKFYNCL